jgi:hypothetical protein
MQEDQTRYKNLIRQAKEKWHEQVGDDSMASTFEQMEGKLAAVDFWQQTTEGLAVFVGPGTFEVFQLPIECEERVCVADSYDITPLLIIEAYDQPYYLLDLAMHNTKLFKGDMYGLEPVAVDFPASPEAALNIDEMFSNSNTIRNQNSPASDGSGAVASHGQGDSNRAGREERFQYFRILENTMTALKEFDSTLPIVIAGTDSEVGDFRNSTKLTTVVHEYIQGNHTNTTLPELSRLAWPIIQSEIISKRAIDAIEQLREKEGLQKSSYDYKDVTEAANMGRVQTLLVGITRKTTDTVSDALQNAVPILTFAGQPDYERITELVKKVLAQGGTILGVGNEMLPAKVPVAAIYRY